MELLLRKNAGGKHERCVQIRARGHTSPSVLAHTGAWIVLNLAVDTFRVLFVCIFSVFFFGFACSVVCSLDSGNSARFDELLQEIRLLWVRRNPGKVLANLEERVLAETASIMLRFSSALQVRHTMHTPFTCASVR